MNRIPPEIAEAIQTVLSAMQPEDACYAEVRELRELFKKHFYKGDSK